VFDLTYHQLPAGDLTAALIMLVQPQVTVTFCHYERCIPQKSEKEKIKKERFYHKKLNTHRTPDGEKQLPVEQGAEYGNDTPAVRVHCVDSDFLGLQGLAGDGECLLGADVKPGIESGFCDPLIGISGENLRVRDLDLERYHLENGKKKKENARRRTLAQKTLF
jgi:hypothetical protein